MPSRTYVPVGIKTGTHINKTKYAVYHMVICNTEKKIRQRDERQIVVKGWEERSFNFKYSCEGDWRRKRQPTPVFIPGKSHGPRSLVGYNLWGHKESDTTERLLCVCVCVWRWYMSKHLKEVRERGMKTSEEYSQQWKHQRQWLKCTYCVQKQQTGQYDWSQASKSY